MTDTEILDWLEANHPSIHYGNHKIYLRLNGRDPQCTETIRAHVQAAARQQLPQVLGADAAQPHLPSLR